MTATPKRPFWVLAPREARVHAIMLAVLLWTVAAAFVVVWPGPRDYAGTLKGADFVHFYTLGRLALAGDAVRLYDGPAQHDLQVSLVPASEGDAFVPVYPPQTGLAFAPYSLGSYGLGAVLWALTTAAIYAWLIRLAWRSGRGALGSGGFAAAAAAAFPPFWNLVLHGQTTAIPLLGFGLGWLALERGRPFLAGLALGLLAVKPQFGLVLAAVVLVGREWRMLAGALTAVLAQAVAVVAVFGAVAWREYASVVARLPEVSPLLEPRPYQLHSVAALTGLLPGWTGTLLWVGVCGAVTILAVRAWTAPVPVAVRFGVVVLASVLVNPHLTVYDATVLALPLLWLGAWRQRTADTRRRRTYWAAVYLLFALLLLPTALLVRVQLSVIVMAYLFFGAVRDVLRPTPEPVIA